jgi:hypothetical protein
MSGYFDYSGQVYQCFRFLGSRQPKAGFFPKQSEVRGFWSEEIEKNVHDFRKSAQVTQNQQNGSASQAAYEGSIPFTRSNFFQAKKASVKPQNQWFTECVPESSELREMPRSYAEFVRNCQENAVPLGARSSARNFESLALNSETEVSCLSPRRPLC